MKFESFKLTMTLRTPMVEPTMGKPLDGLLSWAAVQRADYAGVPDPIAMHHELFLERHETDDGWCFKASNLEFDWVGPLGAKSYIKRQRVGDYAEAKLNGYLRKSFRVDTGTGSMKAGLFVHPIRMAYEIRAWGIGHIDSLRALMPYVTHVGKLRHHDCGAVATWKIERDDEAVHLWTNRPLPKSSEFATAISHAPSIGALVAPYWQRTQHTEILLPV